jgi:hypothetical protein
MNGRLHGIEGGESDEAREGHSRADRMMCRMSSLGCSRCRLLQQLVSTLAHFGTAAFGHKRWLDCRNAEPIGGRGYACQYENAIERLDHAASTLSEH